MPRVDEFDTFYTSTRRHLLHLTYALSADRVTTMEAVEDAYRQAWRDWSRLRGEDPVAFVRHVAGRSAAFVATTHPWRRRRDDSPDTDGELLRALQRLSPDSRRLFVLQTVGELGLETAARDVGLTDEAALERTQQAMADLQEALGCDLDTMEARLVGLHRVTDRMSLPRPTVVRRESRRRTRRNTFAAVAAVAALVVGAGLVATDSELLSRAEAQPQREQIGTGTADAEQVAQRVLGADQDQLLDADQISRLDPSKTWRVASTDASVTNTQPYATCAEARFADPRLRAAYVRTYAASGQQDEGAAEAIEVSRSERAAHRAYRTMLRWYSDCALPRVQLLSSYTVDRPGLDVRILQLRTYGDPNRTFTVGLSRSGVVNSALVHEVDGDQGPDIDAFAQSIRDSMAMVCGSSGGDCGTGLTATRSVPPQTSTEPEFLGIVDLPPVAGVDQPWAGTEPAPLTDGRNPAATVCDNAAYSGASVQSTSSRTFVIPGQERLPEQFGVSETVARFTSDDSAARFVDRLAERIDGCADRNLSASIDQDETVEGQGVEGRTWRVTFEVDADTTVYYRVALVRRGADVAQLSFSPTRAYDVGQEAFDALAVRAGERLAYMS